MNKQTGFLLSYLKYGDHDAVLHCFTQEAGFQSFFIRGIYASKNKKKAYLMPLNELLLSLSPHQLNAKLPTVQKIEVGEDAGFEMNVLQSSVVFFVADFLNQTLKNEQANALLYYEIGIFRAQLFSGHLQAHLIFLVKILNIFGVAPLLSDALYLNIEKGVFQNEVSFENLDQEISAIWKSALEEDAYENLTIDKRCRKNVMDSILHYYKVHFPEFHIPKSLQVLTQLFE